LAAERHSGQAANLSYLRLFEDCVIAYREALDPAELLSLRSEASTAAYNLIVG
jgi:hypothetical protein